MQIAKAPSPLQFPPTANGTPIAIASLDQAAQYLEKSTGANEDAALPLIETAVGWARYALEALKHDETKDNDAFTPFVETGVLAELAGVAPWLRAADAASAARSAAEGLRQLVLATPGSSAPGRST